MIRILPDYIPRLETTGLVDNEAIAFGVSQDGVIIHFIERDECVIVEWSEVIVYGRELLKAHPIDAPTPEEIESPTKRDDADG